MKTFKVITKQTVYEETWVEAETAEQASELAYNDTGAFDWQLMDCEGWHVDSVIELGA